MGKTVWQGELLYDLLNLPWSQFTLLHPDIKKNTYKGKRVYWNNKLKKGEIEMPKPPHGSSIENFGEILRLHNMTPELANEFRQQGFHVGFIKDNEGHIEYTIPLPNAKRQGSTGIEEYDPIEPARIRPTRSKRVASNVTRLLVYGDGQVDFRRIIHPTTGEQDLVPLHNLQMHRIILRMNARFRPQHTVNLGDFADMTALSRFQPDSDHFHKTLGPSLSWINHFYGQMYGDNPDAEHIETDSNHAIRPKKRVLEAMPAMHDFVIPGEDYPLMTYYRLANLGRWGINFVSGYGNAEYVYGEGKGVPWVFKHGIHSSSSPGATVRKEAAENPYVSVFRAHGHGQEEYSTTDRNGEVHRYIMTGSSCVNTGPVPGYRSSIDDFNRPVHYHNQKHVNCFYILEDYGNGRYVTVPIYMYDGVAFYNGERFDGNEPFEFEQNFGYLSGEVFNGTQE